MAEKAIIQGGLINEPVFIPKEGDYGKPYHIIVKGSNEDFGFDLTTIAKNEHGQ